MRRKEFIEKLTLCASATISLPLMMFESCAKESAQREMLTNSDIDLINEVGEIIIPETATSPGAKAANVGAYINTVLVECRPKEELIDFIRAIDSFKALVNQVYQTSFKSLSLANKTKIIEVLQQRENEGQGHFLLFRSWILKGYFTSEIGMTIAMNYAQVPGRFDACVEFNPNDLPYTF